MGVTEAHLVQVTLGDARDHVLHVRADGADARKLVRFCIIVAEGRPRNGDTGGKDARGGKGVVRSVAHYEY